MPDPRQAWRVNLAFRRPLICRAIIANLNVAVVPALCFNPMFCKDLSHHWSPFETYVTNTRTSMGKVGLHVSLLGFPAGDT